MGRADRELVARGLAASRSAAQRLIADDVVARWHGVRVLTFSLGFGPKLLSVKRGDTEYCLSLIPLGGTKGWTAGGLAETGLVGFSLFIGMMGLLFARWAKAYPALKTHPVYLGLLITVCIRFFPFAPLTSFFISWFAIPLWLFIGWLNALTTTPVRKDAAT